MLYREIIAVCSEIHTKHINTVCGQNVELLNVKLVVGTAVAQWLRCCATNRKVAGSIPASVSGFFIDIKSFRSHYGPGVELGL